MKHSKKRFLPLIPMILWIFLWAAIVGVILYFTTHPTDIIENGKPVFLPDGKTHKQAIQYNKNPLLWIGVLEIPAVVAIVWYCMSCTRLEKTGIANIVLNVIVLDIPAILMMNHWFKIKKVEDAKANAKNVAYVKPEETVDQKDEEEFDVNLADWEKEELKKKHPDKYAKYVKNEHVEVIVDEKIQIQRDMIRGFAVYLILVIYKKDPKIVNTYQIIQQYKAMVEDEKVRAKLVADFVKMPKLDTFINNYKPKVMTAKALTDVLTKTDAGEFEVALKQDRVQIQIDAKDNWYDRCAKKKAPTKKAPAKKATKKAVARKMPVKKTTNKTNNGRKK